MYKFIFRMTDNTKYIIDNIQEGFENAIWDNLDEYCMMFESESNKVKSVMQVAM